MKRYLLAAAVLLAGAWNAAHANPSCADSMDNFKEAYLQELAPALLATNHAGRLVTRTLERLQEDPETLAGWKAAPAAKRAEFLKNLQAEARVVSVSMERAMRKKQRENPNFREVPAAQCIPPALLAKYPALPEYLRLQQAALPLAITLAIDGIPVVLEDDTPAKVAKRKEASMDLLSRMPPFPFFVAEQQAFALLAAAGTSASPSQATVTDVAQAREWSRQWFKYASGAKTFHASDDQDAVVQAVLQKQRVFLRAHFPDKDADRIGYFISTTSRDLIKPFVPR